MAEPLTNTNQRPLQLSPGMGAAHQNRYLFSDHYLDQLLVKDGRWGTELSRMVLHLITRGHATILPASPRT